MRQSLLYIPLLLNYYPNPFPVTPVIRAAPPQNNCQRSTVVFFLLSAELDVLKWHQIPLQGRSLPAELYKSTKVPLSHTWGRFAPARFSPFVLVSSLISDLIFFLSLRRQGPQPPPLSFFSHTTTGAALPPLPGETRDSTHYFGWIPLYTPHVGRKPPALSLFVRNRGTLPSDEFFQFSRSLSGSMAFMSSTLCLTPSSSLNLF